MTKKKLVDTSKLITVEDFVTQQKANDKKPKTKAGIYYAVEAGSIRHEYVGGKLFIYKNQ